MDFRFQDYLSAPVSLLKQRAWMRRSETLSREEMEVWALERLRWICCYAREHIPFYRKRFQEADFDPQRLDSLDYYRRLPILDKDMVRESLGLMLSDEARKLGAVWCETSGSTGTAMRFLLDRNVNTASFALFWRTWSMAPGWWIGRRQAMISGYAEGKWQYLWNTRILALSSFHLSPENVVEYYELIRKYRPAFLRGYPSSLFLFAKLLNEKGLSLHFPILFSGAESLLPFQREFVESFFGGRVIDHYTHWERTASICECMHGRLHAQNDYGWHEILRPDGTPAGSGETGALVCTGLHNLAMPLLRYDTRDLAVWSEEQTCPCGSHFPIVQEIVGRVEDVVLTPEGRLVGRLDAAFKFSPHIRLACIHQPSVERLTVNIVSDPNYRQDEGETRLIRELRKRLGDGISIEIRLVEDRDIPRTPGGKVRFVTSDVPAEMKQGHF